MFITTVLYSSILGSSYRMELYQNTEGAGGSAHTKPKVVSGP